MVSTHLCGAGLAFLAFSASLVIGLFVNNEFVTLVLRSLLVMVVFYILGCIFSFIGQKAVLENFENEVKQKQQQAEAQPDESNVPLNQNPDAADLDPITVGNSETA